MSEPLRDAPAVSVIVPARDAADTIQAAVAALVAQRDDVDAEVLVVDDGSRDDTGDLAAAAGARVLRAHGDGPARARNLGVAHSKGTILVFTDADCVPTPGFLAALVAPLADPAVAGTKGAYRTDQRGWTPRFVQLEYEERYRRMERRRSIDFVDTYAAAYRRDVFEAAGGFDERYKLPSTEDQELSFRIAATGATLVFAPQARVIHRHAATLSAYLRKKFKIGTFKVATLRRHPGKAIHDDHTPETLKLQLLLAPCATLGSLGAIVALLLHAPPQTTGLLCAPGLAFLLTAAPLWWASLRADPWVGLWTPLFVWLRAWALGLGVVRGMWAELRGGVLAPEQEAP